MAQQKDLVVKMTINDKDFQNGLNNAKTSVKNFDKNSGISALTKKIGALGLALKAVDVAKDTFIKGINSTEQSADSAAASMRSLTKSYDAVIQALANGNTGFALTIDNLAQIAKNAKAAYDALDKLGTFQMWSSADRSIINAQIAEDRVIVNSKTSTLEEKIAAQSRIDKNTKRLEGLTQQYLTNTKNAQVAVLRDLGKAAESVTDEMLSHYVESWKKGTLEAEAQKFYQQNAKTGYRDVPMSLGDQTWTQQQEYTIWSSPEAQAQYHAMRSLITARENEEGWGEYFRLVKEEGQIRSEIANTVNKANKASQKELTTIKSTGGGGSTSSALTMTEDQIAQYIARSAAWESLNADREKDSVIVDIELEDEDIVEPELDALMATVAAAQERMKQLAAETAAAMTAANSLASAFTAFGDVSDGTLGKMSKGLGGIIGQIVATMQAMMALTGAETVEGVADVFANTKGDVWIKLAAAGIALSGILGIIATAKNSFAGSYADGGIVGGSSYSGDKLWARVNSGEMILNKAQQQALATGGGQVKFVIEGSQLKGVLQNYETIENI